MRLKNVVDFQSDIDWEAQEVVEGRQISTAWFQTARAEEQAEKKEVTQELVKSRKTLRYLGNIIGDRYRISAHKETDFSQPNYEHQLIYSRGYQQALKDIYDLIPKRVTDQD